MKPKKIKKLALKKETISVLNDYELSKQKGGSGYLICPSYGCNYSESCFVYCESGLCG